MAVVETELDVPGVISTSAAIPRLVDPVLEARVLNAVRIRQHRSNLISSGAFAIAEIAEGRGTSPAAAYQWLNRATASNRLFSVNNAGQILIPADLLDEVFEPVSHWQPVLEALAEAGVVGWDAWGWLKSPTTWLGNRVPTETITSDPEAVKEAASRKASAASDR